MWEKGRSWADCMSKRCRIIFYGFMRLIQKSIKKETSQKDILLAGQSVANYPAREVRLPVFERRRSDRGSRANERRNETCVWIPKRGKNKIKASTQFLARRSVNSFPLVLCNVYRKKSDIDTPFTCSFIFISKKGGPDLIRPSSFRQTN